MTKVHGNNMKFDSAKQKRRISLSETTRAVVRETTRAVLEIYNLFNSQPKLQPTPRTKYILRLSLTSTRCKPAMHEPPSESTTPTGIHLNPKNLSSLQTRKTKRLVSFLFSSTQSQLNIDTHPHTHTTNMRLMTTPKSWRRFHIHILYSVHQ